MQTLRRTAALLIWPAIVCLGSACDRLDPPTAAIEASIQPPPGAGPGKVTGGGQIDIVDATGATIGKATFGFNANLEEGTDAVARGHLNYVNHATGDHLNCKVTVVAVTPAEGTSPGSAVFASYDCPKGSGQEVEVDVVDQDEPGDEDVFIITINEGPPEGGIIRSGNIQVHKAQEPAEGSE